MRTRDRTQAKARQCMTKKEQRPWLLLRVTLLTGGVKLAACWQSVPGLSIFYISSVSFALAFSGCLIMAGVFVPLPCLC